MDASTGLVGVQLSWAIISSYVIQWIKGLRAVPFVNYEEKNLNRVFSAAVAAATGAGIYFTFNHSAGTLLITGLTMINAYHFISHGVQQFALQHAIYKGIIAPPQPAAIQAEIRKEANGTSTKDTKVEV